VSFLAPLARPGSLSFLQLEFITKVARDDRASTKRLMKDGTPDRRVASPGTGAQGFQAPPGLKGMARKAEGRKGEHTVVLRSVEWL
jgi:hypothetical protein